MSKPSKLPAPGALSRAEKLDVQKYREAYRRARLASKRLRAEIATLESIAKTTRLPSQHFQRNLSHLRCLMDTGYSMLLDAAVP